MRLNGIPNRLFLFAALVAALGACSTSSTSVETAPSATPAASADTNAAEQMLIISAAASTKEAIEALAEKFQTQSGANVTVNLGSSSALANQIIAGAPADLFLSANQQWADEVKKNGQAEAMTRLLTNWLVIVAAADNPAGVQEPKDFLSAGVKKIALAGEKVPAGIYAGQALAKLGILDPLAAEGKIVRGQDVRSALSYVERGEAEAGIVYSTDANIASGLEIVHEFDPSLHDEIVYALVLLKHGGDKPRARQLYEYLQSPEAEAVYTQFGFARLR
jgi:molybdate transport system substrate-binding protein